jgi:ribosomal protein S18 acetylase RimI-like enzyme
MMKNESGPLSIRPATSSDIPHLVTLDHHFSTDHVWQMSFNSSGEEVSISFREVRLPRPMRVQYPHNPEHLIDEWTNKLVLLIAEQEHSLAGYICIEQSTAPQIGWITDLVVSLPARRQGVGSNLLHQARSWCKQQGYTRIVMEMQSKNFPAIQLARKAGFVYSGYSDQYFPDQDIALFFALEI